MQNLISYKQTSIRDLPEFSRNLEYILQLEQLLAMQAGNFHYEPITFRCKMYLNHAPISSSPLPVDQTQLLATRSQRNNSVVVRLQSFSKFTNCCPVPPLISLDMKQQEILQIGDPKSIGQLLAKAQESSQLISKVGKSFNLPFTECSNSRHEQGLNIYQFLK